MTVFMCLHVGPCLCLYIYAYVCMYVCAHSFVCVREKEREEREREQGCSVSTINKEEHWERPVTKISQLCVWEHTEELMKAMALEIEKGHIWTILLI